MFWKLVSLFIVCLGCIDAEAQVISISTTVTDSDSQTWNNGTWSAQLYSPNGTGYYNGTQVPTASFGGSLSSAGLFVDTTHFYNTNTITPTGVMYTVTVCSQTSAPCSSFNIPVTSSIQFGAAVNALIKAPRFSSGSNAYGYLDAEVTPVAGIGSSYFNVTLGVIRTWNGSSWQSGGSAISAAMAGLNTYLPMTDGSGLTIHDLSGNGHNATISSGGTQVWNAQGLKLNAETATLPNNGGLPTVGLCAYFPAAAVGAFSEYFYYISPMVGSQWGYSFGNQNDNSFAHGTDSYSPTISFSNGSPNTVTYNRLSGNHCLEFLPATTSGGLDHIIIDGVEASYINQGNGFQFLGGAQLTATITMSSNSIGTFTNPPELFSVWNAVTGDSIAMAQARTIAEMQRLSAAGVIFGQASTTNQQNAAQCIVDGTSIDQGFEASATPISLVTFTSPCTVTNFAVSGQSSADMAGGFQDRAYRTVSIGSLSTIYNGGPTNSLVGLGETPQEALQDILLWNRQAHLQGAKTIASTMLSRGCTGTGGATGDVLAQEFNALLLANGDQFDWVDNPAAFPQLGATGAYSNTTYFNTDAGCPTHPTNAGQVFYVQSLQSAYNGVWGSPMTPISAAYTQLPSDRLIVASSTTAYAVTLIDADTASFNIAGKLCLSNIGTGVVTLTPVNSETINGAANLAVAASTTACIRPFVADAATAGANWVKVQP